MKFDLLDGCAFGTAREMSRPTRIGEVGKVLDFGAGPTIHVAASFRNTASEIYLADYLPQNREELNNFSNGFHRNFNSFLRKNRIFRSIWLTTFRKTEKN
ncbi:unnamed protein product [Cylicostephanus goldi]|uniref:Uncharacterized protein n=1 Tax=Cylicostephanus goldi TaxID=71465 RepID=A0A3P7PXE1_CYLGO|nr:unnamed protein product [Cylicostephanus goldi]